MEDRNKVLVVDDQEGIRKMLEETCALLGFDVMTATSGDEALQLAQSNKFKAALIDLKMPGLNGVETIQKLLALDPEIKVALMTGYGDVYMQGEALSYYACRLIRKPFELEEVREFLEGAWRGLAPT